VTPYQLAVVLLRVYAITLLVNWLAAVVGSVPFLWYWSDAPHPDRVRMVFQGFWVLAGLGIILFLLLRTDIVARLICRGLPGGEEVSVSARDLAILGFSILGLYCFIDGIPRVGYEVVGWHLGYGFDLDERFVASAVETVVGLLLFVTPKGFLRIAGWLRRAGAPERTTPQTPPA
jgi:hypothetical protein